LEPNRLGPYAIITLRLESPGIERESRKDAMIFRRVWISSCLLSVTLADRCFRVMR